MNQTESEVVTEVTEVTEATAAPPVKKVNPLLSRRMVNAHSRLSGCGEHDPSFQCEHRIQSRRELEKLLVLYEAEQP